MGDAEKSSNKSSDYEILQKTLLFELLSLKDDRFGGCRQWDVVAVEQPGGDVFEQRCCGLAATTVDSAFWLIKHDGYNKSRIISGCNTREGNPVLRVRVRARVGVNFLRRTCLT